MAKGSSGRIVLEIDPSLKKQLYSLLALENLTLKEWFLRHATKEIDEKTNKLVNSNKQSKTK